jgi:hypothetical protein
MSKQIGIVFSPGWGAGFSTWGNPAMALDQELAQAIEDGATFKQQEAIVLKNWDRELLDPLEVEWVAEGTKYKISEHDGNEHLEIMEDINWRVAE